MLALYNTLIVLLTVAAMELVAALAHKYIMHGWGWGWHESHHEPRTSWFEVNDLYAVVFAVLAVMARPPRPSSARLPSRGSTERDFRGSGLALGFQSR